MSLLHLVQQSVAIKFTESAKDQFDPSIAYAFRLTGVDAMGFLQLQELRLGAEGVHEVSSEPFWINKDFIRDLREFQHVKNKESVRFIGLAPKPEPAKAAADALRREVTPPKPAKAKAGAKPKLALN